MALENQIAGYCEQNHISGVIRVTVKGKTQYEQMVGYADFANQVPFSKDSMFTFYSLSKPFCAIGLLKLKDKGLIDLDAHPANYVPEMEGFDQRVTVRHMLHHISGLPDFEQTEEFAKKHAPGYAGYARKHLKLLATYPSRFAPGTDAQYANINFVPCALMIENLSGMPYAQYMEQEVFRPLGMKTALVDNETLTVPNRVKGYELENGVLTAVDRSYDWMHGAGDILGTVDDVYCLNKAIKNRLLLREETWEEVLTPSPLNRMGMGCTVTTWHGKKRVTHNGGSTGFRTLHIQLVDDDFDLIFLSNSGFGNARHDLSEMILQAFYSRGTAVNEMIEMDKGYI